MGARAQQRRVDRRVRGVHRAVRPGGDGNVDDLTQWDGTKIALLAGTATLGVAAQALILVVPLWRAGFRWHLRFGLHGIGLRSAGQVALWTFAAVLLEQVGSCSRRASRARPPCGARADFGAYRTTPGPWAPSPGS
nr:lipid II flippase MurJ [Cellulosimicrobium sp. MM]